MHLSPGVKDAHDCAHAPSAADGCQAGHAAADDQHLGRRHAAGGGDLAGEESAEVVRRLNDRPGGGVTVNDNVLK